MSDFQIGIGGAWKRVHQGGGFAIGVAGVWKTIACGWIGVSGVWKQFFVNAVFSIPSGLMSDFAVGGDTLVLTMLNDGTWVLVGSSGPLGAANWVTPTTVAPGGYTIRAHQTSGTPVSGPLDSDVPLSNPTTSWSLSTPSGSSRTGTFDLTLKDSGGNVVQTSTVTLNPQS